MTARFTWMILGVAVILLSLGIAESNEELFLKYRQQGIDEVKANNLEDAEQSFRTALSYNPDDPDCNQVLHLITEANRKKSLESDNLKAADETPKNHSLRIMAFAEYFNWSEHDNGERLSTESGPLFGLEINGDYTENHLRWLRYRAKIFRGDVNVDGALPDQTPYRSNMEYRGVELGTDVDLVTLAKTDRGDVLNLFLGLGYRVWERDLGGKLGYSETWQTAYCTTGLWGRYGLSASNQSQLFGKLEVRLPVYNNQSVDMSGLPDLTPGWAPSYYGSLGVDWSRITLEAYVQALYFKKSDEEFVGIDAIGDAVFIYQPKSLGISAGLKVGVVF